MHGLQFTWTEPSTGSFAVHLTSLPWLGGPPNTAELCPLIAAANRKISARRRLNDLSQPRASKISQAAFL